MKNWFERVTGRASCAKILEDYRDRAHWMGPVELAEEVLDDNRLTLNQKFRVIETLGL